MKNGYLFFKVIAFGVLAFSMSVCSSSCITTKKLKYFRDLPDSTVVQLPAMKQEDRIIDYGDRLEITIHAKEKEAVEFFNVQQTQPLQGGVRGGNMGEYGHLVDVHGMVEFPIIGFTRAVGLTTKEFKDTLTGRIRQYVVDPLVDVKFTNFRITMLGEVRSPGTYSLAMQRTTIFEALAAAGDLPQHAKRYDIHLYRDYKGQRTITKIDLRSKDILYNPELFQMRHNDVLYVQPQRSTIFREDFGFVSSIFGLGVGLITLVVAIFNNN